MFGMGFTEIFLIAIVAIIALGPEKLPTAMVDIAKFFRKFKSGLDDAKSTLDQELELEKLKQEADKYKSQLTEVQNTMNPHNLDRLIDDSFDPKPTTQDTTPEIQDAELVSTKSESTLAEQAPKQTQEQSPTKKEKKAKKEKVSFKDKKAKIKEEV